MYTIMVVHLCRNCKYIVCRSVCFIETAFQTHLPLNYYMQVGDQKAFTCTRQPDWPGCTGLKVPEVKSWGWKCYKVVIEGNACATVVAHIIIRLMGGGEVVARSAFQLRIFGGGGVLCVRELCREFHDP